MLDFHDGDQWHAVDQNNSPGRLGKIFLTEPNLHHFLARICKLL